MLLSLPSVVLGAKRLGAKRLGGETTWGESTWGRNDLYSFMNHPQAFSMCCVLVKTFKN